VATYPAIAAVGLAMKSLLTNARTGTEFATATFPLFQATDLSNGLDGGIGVSIFLYRVVPNATRRNDPPRPRPDGRRGLPMLPLDLYYLLTVWGGSAEMQQRLLGWTMRTLQDAPILTAGLLNSSTPPPPPEISPASVFRPDETVELALDPLSLQDMNVIWDLFKLNQPQALQLSVTYVARMVVIESDVSLADSAPVQTREFDYAEAAST
jgi:hypothetical protein